MFACVSATAAKLIPPRNLVHERGSHEVVRAQASPELVFGVVGHIGSGASEIAKQLRTVLSRSGFSSNNVHILKASIEIRKWANVRGRPVPQGSRKTFEHVSALQDLGDQMRCETNDHAAVAKSLVQMIRLTRGDARSIEVRAGAPIEPDHERRAYILDSIRHPAEVELLRHLYRSAFVLIGVVCEEDTRKERIQAKLEDAGKSRAQQLMARDAKAPEKYGQRVSDAFHLADMFLDNSAPRLVDDTGAACYDPKKGKPNRDWTVPAELERLVKLLTRSQVERATPHEAAMYIAFGAQMRSACLSRQVGAALTNQHGNTVATGTNEVPRAGGGVYGAAFEEQRSDHRCAFKDDKYCSNNREQDKIIKELMDSLSAHIEKLRKDATDEFAVQLQKHASGGATRSILDSLEPKYREFIDSTMKGIEQSLRMSRIGGLLEFSRAVHAEMDAILAATRSEAPIVGGRLYVTTFPCHYCARHIVAAGLDEVQYIEPYPKSKALKLHEDAITTSASRWTPPSKGGDKVLIHPFTGIAPRLYERVFLKETELKNAAGDLCIGELAWGDRWHIQRISYTQLEAELTKDMK